MTLSSLSESHIYVDPASSFWTSINFPLAVHCSTVLSRYLALRLLSTEVGSVILQASGQVRASGAENNILSVLFVKHLMQSTDEEKCSVK